MLSPDEVGKKRILSPYEAGRRMLSPDEVGVSILRKPSGATRSFAPTLGETVTGFAKEVSEMPKTLGEVGLMLATAAPVWVIGSLGKIGITGYGELKGKDTTEQAERFQEEIGKAVWKPQTRAGKVATELIGKGFEFIATPVREAAALVGESWDSKTVEAVSQFIGELALFHYGAKGIKKGKVKIPEWYNKMSKREQTVVDNMVKEVIKRPREKPAEGTPTPKEEIKPAPEPTGEVIVEPKPELKGKEPWMMTRDELEVKYKKAGDVVDGRTIRSEIPNMDSISASIDNSTTLPGIYEIPLSEFEGGLTGKHYSVSGTRRIAELADEITASGVINPLIVVIDAKGPYILEGATRAEALYKSGAKAFPAKIVLDEGSFYDATKQAIKEGRPIAPEVLKDYPDLKPATKKPAPEPSGEIVKPLIKEAKKYKTADEFVEGQGLYEGSMKAMKDISASTAQIIESTKVKPEIHKGVKVAKEAMIEHDRNIRAAEFTSKQLEKVVKEVVPKEDRQMEMVHAYEQKMRGKHWDNLTKIEKGVVKWAAQEKAKLNKYIKDNNVLEMMESKNINHIFHHWINPVSGKPYAAVYGKFSKGLPQAKQRTVLTYETGINEAGLKPATTNLGKLIGIEWEAATRANSARQLFKELHGIKGDPEMSIELTRGKPPCPVRMVERWDKLQKQGLSDSYIRYDSPFLDKTMAFKSSDGTMIRMKGAVGVQKDLYPFVRAYIESPVYGNLSNLNFASKSLKLGISMFHVVSLGMQELANFRVPFVHIPKGLKLRKELGSTTKLLHQEGLELFKGYEDLGYQNTFFEGATIVGKSGNVVAWPVTKMRDFIFNVVQPGMKTSFADMQFRKLLPRYLKKAGETMTAEKVMVRYEQGKPVPVSARVCARDVVKKSDGHFSGEHYKRSLLETNRFMVKLYFSPEAKKFWQAALLSPTWQREHLLVAKNVAKSFMPDSMIKKLGMEEIGLIKSQYRKYALGGIMIVGAVDLWNQMSTQVMDGESKHIWENPEGKGFAVRAWWDEPDYTITTKNGQRRTIKGGPGYIRPLKSLFEVAEWGKDPIKKVSYKLSPMVSAIGQQLFGIRGYKGIEDIPERLWDFTFDVTTPIVVDQAILAAEGKKAIPGVVTSFFGMPASKAKRKTGRALRTTREMRETHKLGR